MRAGLLVAVLVAGCGAKDESAAVPVERPLGKDVKPDVTVSAERLYRDYRDGNPAAADAKYLGKVLKATGRVLAVEQDGGGYAVGIETGPNVVASGVELKAAVVGLLGASSRAEAAKLKPFDDVAIVGTFVGRESGPGRMGGIRLPLQGARIELHTPRK